MIQIPCVGTAASFGRVKDPKHAIICVDARRKRAFPDRGANKGERCYVPSRVERSSVGSGGQVVSISRSAYSPSSSFFSAILSGAYTDIITTDRTKRCSSYHRVWRQNFSTANIASAFSDDTLPPFPLPAPSLIYISWKAGLVSDVS